MMEKGDIPMQANPARYRALPFIFSGVLFFALFNLPLFASVFNHRLTPTGSLTLLFVGLLVGLLTVWTVFTGLGILMQATVSGYLLLAGAFIAAAGFGGLVLPEKTA
ncbi:MAG: hypothetical protein ACYC3P_11115 [Bellilinea sp.]